jgi:pimeloyl-ACP methyl ester carboxylesterase
MNSKQLVFQNTIQHYRVMGEGKPVVLLHGFGEDSSIWDDIAVALSPNYRLLIPDLPGTGASAPIVGANIGLETYAEIVKQILSAENSIQCTMIGHSMGGYITLAFAEKYPEMLHAMGLFHSSAYADDETKKETRKKAIAFIKENGVNAFLKTSTPGLFKDADKSKNDIDQLIEKGNSFTPDTLIQYYEAMIKRPDRTQILRTFSGPVLFMLGMHDKAVPFEQGLEQSHLPALSHLFILRESGHMGMIEEAEKSLLNLEHFLQAIYV